MPSTPRVESGAITSSARGPALVLPMTLMVGEQRPGLAAFGLVAGFRSLALRLEVRVLPLVLRFAVRTDSWFSVALGQLSAVAMVVEGRFHQDPACSASQVPRLGTAACPDRLRTAQCGVPRWAPAAGTCTYWC